MELAKAYIQIVPSAKGIKDNLTSVLKGEGMPAGQEAGSSVGRRMVSGIKNVLAAAGIGQAIRMAIGEGGDLEQSIGGVETLFKESSERMVAQAYGAWKTAGLSANEYMETVTGFSASLLQSLSGDTEKAAEMADMALRDMADNANKMGTSMESIRYAYQGFAKQNYTMLDNLKLGYGGTKTEMERLLADAQKISKVSYNIDNLSDVYQAIHVIQKELGITGATADEAAKTLSGSAAAMKAAFKNVIGNWAIGEDMKPALSAMKESAVVFFKDNLFPALGNILDGFPEIAGAVLEGSGDIIIQPLLEGISERLPEFVPKGLEMGAKLADGLIAKMPVFVKLAGELLRGLVKGIINGLPTLIQEGPRIINAFASAIYSAIFELIKLGMELIVSLVKGIWDNRHLILENAGEIFLAFLNVFSLSNMLTLGKNLLVSLKSGISSMFQSIKGSGGEIMKKLVSGIKELALHPVQTVRSIIGNVKDAFFKVNWHDIGKNIISGIVNGLKNGVGAIISAAKDAAESALRAAKKALGIHSPSRVFEDEVGKMIDLGLAGGIQKHADIVSGSMKELSRSTIGMFDVAEDDFSIKTSRSVGGTEEDYQSVSVLLLRLFQLLQEYLPHMVNLKVVMDTGEVVGVLAPELNEELGNIAEKDVRGI